MTGCSGHPGPRTLASSGSLDTIAAVMRQMVSGNGIPVEDDYIRCVVAIDRRSAECHGQTATEPAKDLKGIFFIRSAPSPGAAGCPGQLTVRVGPALSDIDVPGPVIALETQKVNPCR
ncbi:MAG: hypothetical protein KGQ66_16590 [Acidobacteriota bacterium]|nr:hypothetical protein [Acidobacteriota bacterium]